MKATFFASTAALAVAATAMADSPPDLVYTLDVSGWTDLTSEVIDLGAGTKVEVTGIGWDVTFTAEGSAWLSDGSFYFDAPGADPFGQVYLTPFVGQDFSGTETTFSPILKLADLGIPNIQLDAGLLEVFYGTFGFDTYVKEESFLYIQYAIVPTPGALALVGLAGLVGRRRRA